MGTWNSRDRETVSGTDFGDRMGVVADSSRNPLSTRSMWRATGADGAGFARFVGDIDLVDQADLVDVGGDFGVVDGLEGADDLVGQPREFSLRQPRRLPGVRAGRKRGPGLRVSGRRYRFDLGFVRHATTP